MDEKDDRLQEASDFFYHLVCNNEKRLKNGLAERERIRKQIQNGEQASGYRAQWLRKSSTRVIHLLQDIAREFDSIYTTDRFSALDLIDVLSTAKKKIESNLSQEDEED